MSELYDLPFEIDPARELWPRSDLNGPGITSPPRQALLDLDQEDAFEMWRLFERVRTGAHVWNARFDRILPIHWRRLSMTHCTPIDVARRAAQLLVTGRETRVLDVGSGPGKFCLIGALATLGHFTGVEQRPHLVEFSRSFARKYAIPRVYFLCANAGDLDWSRYNAFYFYNPFYENLDPDKKIDDRVELSPSLYDQYITMAQELLAQALPTTRVVTYHGMGGDMPDGYERILREFQNTGFLELWIRNPSSEERISFPGTSSPFDDSQPPCLPAFDATSVENRLLVSGCAPTAGTAPAAEESSRPSAFQNPGLELPILCSRF
jgi:hypothetical protein